MHVFQHNPQIQFERKAGILSKLFRVGITLEVGSSEKSISPLDSQSVFAEPTTSPVCHPSSLSPIVHVGLSDWALSYCFPLICQRFPSFQSPHWWYNHNLFPL